MFDGRDKKFATHIWAQTNFANNHLIIPNLLLKNSMDYNYHKMICLQWHSKPMAFSLSLFFDTKKLYAKNELQSFLLAKKFKVFDLYVFSFLLLYLFSHLQNLIMFTTVFWNYLFICRVLKWIVVVNCCVSSSVLFFHHQCRWNFELKQQSIKKEKLIRLSFVWWNQTYLQKLNSIFKNFTRKEKTKMSVKWQQRFSKLILRTQGSINKFSRLDKLKRLCNFYFQVLFLDLTHPQCLLAHFLSHAF